MPKILIPATTSAVVTERISISVAESPTTIMAFRLGTGEEIAFKISDDEGATKENLVVLGSPIVLSPNNKCVTVYGPVVFWLDKPSTVGAVQVVMHQGYVNTLGTSVEV